MGLNQRHLITLGSSQPYLKLGHTIVIKIVPPHNLQKPLLRYIGINKMLPLRCSDPTMDFASRLPAKEARHFPIDKSHNLVIVNDAVGLGKVIVHKTHIRVGRIIGVRGEEDLCFQRVDTAVGQDVGIWDDVAPTRLTCIRRLDGVQLSKHLLCLLLEGRPLGLR